MVPEQSAAAWRFSDGRPRAREVRERRERIEVVNCMLVVGIGLKEACLMLEIEKLEMVWTLWL